MGQVLVAPGAKLLELELGRGVATIFLRRIIAALALGALQEQFDSYIACHVVPLSAFGPARSEKSGRASKLVVYHVTRES
jgi:hypothetical protein